MNWYPLEELVKIRMDELQEEARRAALARPFESRGGLAEAVCRWRTRIGGAVLALGRLIVPPDARAALAGPARKLDHC